MNDQHYDLDQYIKVLEEIKYAIKAPWQIVPYNNGFVIKKEVLLEGADLSRYYAGSAESAVLLPQDAMFFENINAAALKLLQITS